MKVIIETTADGSPTFYREDIDEHYHSVKGALAESQHVYINSGWKAVSSSQRPIRVFEIGFGTGLNAALTAQAALQSQTPTEYYSVELYPLPDTATTLYSEALSVPFRTIFLDVNKAPWQQSTKINPYFSLLKIEDNLLTMELPKHLDVVYFDAFAPEKQPEMWDESIFRKIYNAMNPGAILTTYCAKGAIRRLLNQLGFTTERLPGPPNGKREILRATKIISLIME
ncbi:MAG: tRNA (5-methylaminomethyl-2-thiouridine)(34)-methyltransferase MnmD [Muribaculaceae bacterium]|nr:tRNA (5-methylaminomethyl-2-thiouridine)(34)-methyltransferase MnmD [Muribaculaceae bacterium]